MHKKFLKGTQIVLLSTERRCNANLAYLPLSTEISLSRYIAVKRSHINIILTKILQHARNIK